jgi:hypothetical protein
MNYTTLQADVADYLHRTDLGTVMPSLIERAEAMLFRELQVKDTAISVAGVTTGEYADLPADFASAQKVTVQYGSVEYSLDYQSQSYNPTGVAVPQFYALENNQIRIFGAGTGQAFTLYYIPKIPNLSVSVTSNWLSDSAPDLYLYATALEGAKFIRDDAEINRLNPLVAGALDSVRRLSERKGQPANASLQIKARR